MSKMEDLLPIVNYMPGYRCHWVYSDQNIPVMIVARYDQNGKKMYRQFYERKGEWIKGMPSSPYPLFGLNTLKNISYMFTGL